MRRVLLACTMLAAMALSSRAQVFQVDQQFECVGGLASEANIAIYSPVGQEFVPYLPVISWAEFWVRDSNITDGFGTDLIVSVHSDSISSEPLAISLPTYAADQHEGLVRFYFSEYVPLNPGCRYVLQLHDLGLGRFMFRSKRSPGGEAYPRGRRILHGVPAEEWDACFCEGRSWLTPVLASTWTSIKALYRP